jgi:hypothetical protein
MNNHQLRRPLKSETLIRGEMLIGAVDQQYESH